MTTAAQMVSDANAQLDLVSPADAWAEVSSGDVVLVDIREPLEWAESIEGSLQIPRGTLEFIADPASARYNPVLDPGKRVIVYCHSGGRAALAGATLKALGYTNVANVLGGFTAWKEAGLPVVHSHAGM